MPQGYQLEILDNSHALRGRAAFPADFPGFSGHFPGNPILPGFMQIQTALDLLQLAAPSHAVELIGVDSAKFTRAILPGEIILLEILPAETGAFDVTLLVEDEAAGRFRVRVSQEART